MKANLLLALVLLIVPMSGCLSMFDDGNEEHDHDQEQPEQENPETNETIGNAPPTLNLTLATNQTTYEANETVYLNYTIEDEGDFKLELFVEGKLVHEENFTREEQLTTQLNLTEEPERLTFEGQLEFTSNTVGNSTALVFITDDVNQTANGEVTVEFTAPQMVEENRTYPETLHFEFGESFGCTGDFLQEAGLDCLSLMEGPNAEPLDGFWVHLGGNYTGLSFTSTVENVLGDSDCYLINGDLEIKGNGHNGSATCEGIIPGGIEWLFIYSYAEYASAQTLTFSL